MMVKVPIMGKKNAAVLLVLFLVVLLWQIPFLFSYKEDANWNYDSFLGHTLDVRLTAASDNPLHVECYMKKRRKIVPKIIQPGQSYVATFLTYAITNIYCNMR